MFCILHLMSDLPTRSNLDRDTVLATIRQHADELRQMRVTAVYLFGSLARGEAGPDSDIDLLIEVERPFGLFQVSEVKRYLEDVLAASVDLVPASALDRRIRENVYRDRIRAA
jgi:predicted nucleotidyltransferase